MISGYVLLMPDEQNVSSGVLRWTVTDSGPKFYARDNVEKGSQMGIWRNWFKVRSVENDAVRASDCGLI